MKKLLVLLCMLGVLLSTPKAETTTQQDQHTATKSSEFFKKMDTDGDGTVSLEEFKAGLSAQKDSAAVEEYFNRLDTNGDGKLTLDEYTKQIKPAATPAQHEQTPSAPLANTPQESEPPKRSEPIQHPPVAPAAPTTNPQTSGIEAFFKKIDINGDGTISLLEFKASPMGQNNPRMAEEYFKKLDADHDGKVTFAEFTARRSQSSSSYHKSSPPKSSTSLVSPHLKDPDSSEGRRRK